MGFVNFFRLKALTAFLASIWLLSGMEALVVLREVADFGEFFVAFFALETAGWQSRAGGICSCVAGFSLAFGGLFAGWRGLGWLIATAAVVRDLIRCCGRRGDGR